MHKIERMIESRSTTTVTPQELAAWVNRLTDVDTPRPRRPAHHGGPTTITNGQGLCANCNHTKQAPGWEHQPPADDITITITTPTGHTHHSRPPRPPHSPPWENPRTFQADLTQYLATA